MPTPLSVLDLSPVTTGTTGAQALRNSLDLARHADRLGFVRYWVAEHHNMPSIASSAPDIMIGQIAGTTTRMRVGSGGVMLPNHAPLVVAERYKVLEGLFPGRIDLGLGRAPGTDPVTSYALRRRQDDPNADDFLDRFQELLLFEQGGFPEGHPFRNVRAMPADVALPPIYLLGSSDYSAQLAAHVGAGFSFAHHFSDFDPVMPMTMYRSHFKPSPTRDKPHAILGCHVVVRRHRRGSRAACLDRRSQLRAAAPGALPAAALAGGGRGARLFAGRQGAGRRATARGSWSAASPR